MESEEPSLPAVRCIAWLDLLRGMKLCVQLYAAIWAKSELRRDGKKAAGAHDDMADSLSTARATDAESLIERTTKE